MILKFRTKPNAVGNTYWLTIDTDKKIYIKDYNQWPADADAFVIGKREMDRLEIKLGINEFVQF